MKLTHIVESEQFTLPMLMELFERAGEMERIVRRGGTRDYENKIMASLFYEPSTRTRFSFESAMHRLGGKVLSTEHATDFSSATLGETLEDTIRVVNHYADVIVLRHNEIGGAKRAAAVSSIPILNAGDGKGGQHPTQALLDLYTIYKGISKLDGLKIAMVGNLVEGRTVRSLSYLLGKFERVKIYFVAPTTLQMKDDMLSYLSEHDVWYGVESELQKILPEVDVVYVTRIERDRFRGNDTEFAKITRQYYIDEQAMRQLPSHSIVMHPLPRVGEIATEVDNDPRAAYFRQTQNGIFIRMALLAWVLEQ